MYLEMSKLSSVIKKQFSYKLRANARFFMAIVITHAIAIALGVLGMNGMSATTHGAVSLQVIRTYSELIVLVSIACAIGAALNLNMRESIDMDFNFTTNRLTSSLTSILVLCVFSIYAAFCTAFGSVLMRIGKYLYIGKYNLVADGFFIKPFEVASSFTASLMYILLFAAVAYCFGALIRRNVWFSTLIFAVVVFIIRSGIDKDIYRFFYDESNLTMFLVKALTAVLLLFLSSTVLTNDLEVRK